ncbi:hypothetical protein S7711_11382 [Stachybotrys chartarum IBT 7711]|uniref:Infection structure specific protein n=1 Tax=Stachybotrys chartarum (strain CBS 109288 / IBT 7711) TaxID=1280523 RepID=A0A084AW85_STACB|nr:hypothetical protein S7711_11382 [Stachybotrys chartarum IBT 7711]
MKLNAFTLTAAVAASTFTSVTAVETENPEYVVAVIKRVTTLVQPRPINAGMARRQEDSITWTTISGFEDVNSACRSALSVLETEVPTDVPTETSLESALATYMAENDIDPTQVVQDCGEGVEVTGSLSSDWASYSSAMSSYMHEYASAIEPAIDACSDEEAITSILLLPFELSCTAIGEELAESAAPASRDTSIIYAALAGVVAMMAFTL